MLSNFYNIFYIRIFFVINLIEIRFLHLHIFLVHAVAMKAQPLES